MAIALKLCGDVLSAKLTFDFLNAHLIGKLLRAALLQLPLEFCLGLTLLHRKLLLTKGLLLFELAL